MPCGQLIGGTMPTMNRRRFIAGVGAAVAGIALLEVVEACASDSTSVVSSTATGSLRGSVVDMSGHPQGIGRIYLLQKNGFSPGAYADVDPTGQFDFGQVASGEYLLRFWGSNQADVPEPLVNPVRIAVAPGAATVFQFRVVVSPTAHPDREIYAGDFFFQEQPAGTPNATVVVPIGTVVCWYNVGLVPHTVSGGPWGDSGPIAHDGNFMWTSNQLGTFSYRCTYHGTEMIATLQVVP